MRIGQTWIHGLCPTQGKATASVKWDEVKVAGNEALAERTSAKLRSEELLVRSLGVVRLMTWEHDGFAFADGYDEKAGRYQALRAGQQLLTLDPEGPGLIVKPELARRQMDQEAAEPKPPVSAPDSSDKSGKGHSKGVAPERSQRDVSDAVDHEMPRRSRLQRHEAVRRGRHGQAENPEMVYTHVLNRGPLGVRIPSTASERRRPIPLAARPCRQPSPRVLGRRCEVVDPQWVDCCRLLVVVACLAASARGQGGIRGHPRS